MNRREFLQSASGLLIPAIGLCRADAFAARAQAAGRGAASGRGSAGARGQAGSRGQVNGGGSFPIEGFGAGTTGGSGGTIFTVTSLADSGANTLREFVENRSGARIIKFGISGTINLLTPLNQLNPNLTIDGSDAPNKGICLRANSESLFACFATFNNTIVKYIRIRCGDFPTPSTDCMQAVGDNLAIDHCSLSWGADENINFEGRNITIQWCIFSENFGNGLVLIANGNVTEVSMHHNLFAHSIARFPALGSGDVDIVNNVMYNWQSYGRANFMSSHGAIRTNLVGNYFKAGADSAKLPSFSVEVQLGGPQGKFSNVCYPHGNISQNRPNNSLPENDILFIDDAFSSTTTTRFNFPQVTETDAFQAYTDVLANAGCRLPCLDPVDARIISDVTNGTGIIVGNQDQVGGYPDLTLPC